MEAEFFARAADGDPVSLARSLVATDSVNPTLSPGGAGEEAIAELAAGWLEGWGFETRVDEVETGRFNVVGTRAGTGPTLLLNGHLDTVGVEGMSDPFGAVVRDGRLWGRGACDMKGGVASILAAARRLAAAGPHPRLVVALTADEEHASVGMAALVEAGVEADLAVVCEPTSLAVMPAHKGFVWVEGSFAGRAAHGSRPEAGVDAIAHAARWLVGLDEEAARLAAADGHPLLGRASLHAGTIDGGTAPPIYPASCTVVVERRTLPGESPEDAATPMQEVLDRLAAADPTVDGTLRTTLARPGSDVPVESDLVQALLRAAGEVGVAPRVEGMTAWVDAAFLNEAGIPAVCFGPGDLAQAHTADEWCEIREIEQAADVLEAFARRLVEAA